MNQISREVGRVVVEGNTTKCYLRDRLVKTIRTIGAKKFVTIYKGKVVLNYVFQNGNFIGTQTRTVKDNLVTSIKYLKDQIKIVHKKNDQVYNFKIVDDTYCYDHHDEWLTLRKLEDNKYRNDELNINFTFKLDEIFVHVDRGDDVIMTHPPKNGSYFYRNNGWMYFKDGVISMTGRNCYSCSQWIDGVTHYFSIDFNTILRAGLSPTKMHPVVHGICEELKLYFKLDTKNWFIYHEPASMKEDLINKLKEEEVLWKKIYKDIKEKETDSDSTATKIVTDSDEFVILCDLLDIKQGDHFYENGWMNFHDNKVSMKGVGFFSCRQDIHDKRYYFKIDDNLIKKVRRSDGKWFDVSPDGSCPELKLRFKLNKEKWIIDYESLTGSPVWCGTYEYPDGWIYFYEGEVKKRNLVEYTCEQVIDQVKYSFEIDGTNITIAKKDNTRYHVKEDGACPTLGLKFKLDTQRWLITCETCEPCEPCEKQTILSTPSVAVMYKDKGDIKVRYESNNYQLVKKTYLRNGKTIKEVLYC